MTNSSTDWNQLLYRGLQAGGAAFIVSAALSQAARHMLINYSGTQSQFNLTMWTLVAVWFLLGLFCLAPVTLALKKRLTAMLGFPGESPSSNPAPLW